MTATDELRAELTKRGVEWRWQDERTTYWYVTVDGEEWGEWTATEMGGYLLLSFTSGYLLTPAQAIAATLGRGECHDEGTFRSWGYFTCSNCKVVVPVEAVREAPSIGKVVPISFCPNCGRKVVDA